MNRTSGLLELWPVQEVDEEELMAMNW